MVCSAILGILVSIAWLALSILLIVCGLASVVGFLIVGVIGLEMLKALFESEFMFIPIGFRFAKEILDWYTNKGEEILYYNHWNFLY
jgi:hypothetical protein